MQREISCPGGCTAHVKSVQNASRQAGRPPASNTAWPSRRPLLWPSGSLALSLALWLCGILALRRPTNSAPAKESAAGIAPALPPPRASEPLPAQARENAIDKKPCLARRLQSSPPTCCPRAPPCYGHHGFRQRRRGSAASPDVADPHHRGPAAGDPEGHNHPCAPAALPTPCQVFRVSSLSRH